MAWTVETLIGARVSSSTDCDVTVTELLLRATLDLLGYLDGSATCEAPTVSCQGSAVEVGDCYPVVIPAWTVDVCDDRPPNNTIARVIRPTWLTTTTKDSTDRGLIWALVTGNKNDCRRAFSVMPRNICTGCVRNQTKVLFDEKFFD